MRIIFLNRLCNSRIKLVVDNICPLAIKQVPVNMIGDEQSRLISTHFQLKLELVQSLHVIQPSIMRSRCAPDKNESHLQQWLWAYYWHLVPRSASMKSRPIFSDPDKRSVCGSRFMLPLNAGVFWSFLEQNLLYQIRPRTSTVKPQILDYWKC